MAKLKVILQFYREAYKAQFLQLGCPIVNTAPEVDDTHSGLKEAVNKAIQHWDKSIQQLIVQGIEAKEIRETTEPAAFAALMISLIEGGVLLSKSTGNLKFLNESLRQVERLLAEISS